MEELLSKGFPYTIGMLDVSGEDLAVLGIPRGPRIGALLEALYTAVIRGEIENKKASLLAHAEHYI